MNFNLDDVEKKITLCIDNMEFTLSAEDVKLSEILTECLDNSIEDVVFNIEKTKLNTIQSVKDCVEFLMYRKGIRDSNPIQKPLKSLVFSNSAEDTKFINSKVDTGFLRILKIINTARYLMITDLFNLGCAKIASDIKANGADYNYICNMFDINGVTKKNEQDEKPEMKNGSEFNLKEID